MTHEPASLSEQAYARLRELIVTLELAPGTVVSEAELTVRLGLGRTPVREAVQRLALERLVDVFPRRGIQVTAVDALALGDLGEVRAQLESLAARLAAERSTLAERAALEPLLAELASAPTDERALIDLDRRIHRHVHRCAHNAYLESTLDEYYALALRIWFLALARVPRLDAAVHEHRALLEAIRDGDGRGAERVMRQHITTFQDAVRRVL